VIGGPRWPSSNPRPSRGGGATHYGCVGTGSPHLDGPRSRRSCKHSSVRWLATIFHGASSASRTNYGSSWAYGSRHAPSGSICSRVGTVVQANARRPSAGARFCVITRGTSSSVVLLPTSPEACRPCPLGLDAYVNVGQVDPA
jgi:hypothetical protein